MGICKSNAANQDFNLNTFSPLSVDLELNSKLAAMKIKSSIIREATAIIFIMLRAVLLLPQIYNLYC